MSNSSIDKNAGGADNIAGKVVVITGASSGLGAALALQLAQRGARLVLGARREDKLVDLARAIGEVGGEALIQRVDVRRKEHVAELARNAIDGFGGIDVWVNNAAIMPASLFVQNDTDEWDALIDTNIKGVLYGIGAALPHMREQNAGHIINVSSTAAHASTGAIAAVYSMTKHAVRMLTESLVAEEAMAGSRVRVTEMAPGMIDSDLKYTVTDPAMRENVMQAYGEGAIMLSPEEMARAIVYAIGEPENISVSSIVVRPTGGD
ncbi:SDR family oxidoreductase [uncultured Actinomyces sp.]|jgi:oxidoreductase, short-chain dehydrogenase/reductase family|uniref:SDR family oxidoreductase n=1 Tax=uncultured Actinomyces sp. TaxID=249061 RepID=UPI0028EE0BB8|nr:SDR family oxidoreductase [uncultured Actinomyces sp.]